MIGCKARQGSADARPADAEGIAEFIFLQMRAGQNLVIHDHVEDTLADLIRIHLRRCHRRPLADLRTIT